MSSALKLKTGQQFGDWTVIREDGLQGNAKMFLVECKCGKQKGVRASVLVAGKSQGCSQCRNPKRIDRTGQKFQRWTVVSFAEIRYVGKDNQEKVYWNCVCECGTERVIEGNQLVRKRTTSCGCHRKEHPLYDCKKHKLWGVYRGMMDRCYYTKHMNYSYYGGRGIEVSEEFREAPAGFWNFVNYMGERPKGTTLDRINNDGHYERGNLRWATMLEQNRNKRNFHGWAGTPTHKSWLLIHHRCHDNCDPAWKDSFLQFLEDMGEKPEGSRLRRRSRQEGYNKRNCYWKREGRSLVADNSRFIALSK